MICAIHQPNFFPWLGYFNKIYKSDVFVFMDNVDYPQSRTSWQKRVAIKANEKKEWINCPIIKSPGRNKIVDVQINDNVEDWRVNIKKRLKQNYSNSKYYYDTIDYVEELIDYRTESISEYNCHTVLSLCKMLDLDRVTVKQSDYHTEKHSTELLIELTRLMHCDSYLCGGGAGGYQEDELFEKNGIKLIYQNFNHPIYEQRGSVFCDGCSILDALFCVGVDEVKKLIRV